MPSMQAEGIKKVKVPQDMTEQELKDAEAAAGEMEKPRYREELRKRATRVAPPPTPTGSGNVVGAEEAPKRTLVDIPHYTGSYRGAVPEEKPDVFTTKTGSVYEAVAPKGVLEADRAKAASSLSGKTVSELQKMQSDPNTGIALKVQIANELKRRQAPSQ